jgi:DNA-binding IclR family transcriptional regulator
MDLKSARPLVTGAAESGKAESDRGRVQSVDRALDIMEALAGAGRGIGIVDLSARVGLHASTVHRLLATLVARGYARQSPQSQRYSLGTRVLQLGRSFHDRSDLRQEAHRYLQQLTEISGETANLVMRDDDEVVYIDQVQSPHLVRMFAEIGRRVPLHSTAGGKAILASWDRAELHRLVAEKGLPGKTKYTITSLGDLELALGEVRRSGYAIDDQEQEEGVRCVAGPVGDQTGDVVAALSLSGPITRMTRSRIAELGALVVRVCGELSAALGYQE